MDKIPANYITGKELARLTGIPTLAVAAKELMYKPKEGRRTKNYFGNFYKNVLKAKYFDIGQGGMYGTLHYKKPNAEQIKKIKDYHLRTGSKYGIVKDTADKMKMFYNDPTFRKYIRKGEFIPDSVLEEKGIGRNQAANITFRLAQHLNGKKFANVDVDLPVNKSIGKKLFVKMSKAPFGNPYQQVAYKEAMNVITQELGDDYFKTNTMESMKRTARNILNREGIPTFNPTKKGSVGFNINEIVGTRAASRVKGLAPYSQFMNIMEGEFNTKNYARFVRDFEKFNNRMQTENKAGVIKDYTKYKKEFLKKNKGLSNSDLPSLSLKNPEQVYGKKRIASLADQGLDLNKSFKDIGYTVGTGKVRTLKEFTTGKEISSLLQAVKNAPQACRKILNYSTGGISTTCAAAIEADPVKAATALEEIKPTSAALGKVRNAARSFLNFAAKGKGFAIGAGLGVGGGALVKKFMNDDPSTYLTNDAQANAMILDTLDQKEREQRMEAMGDAPELLDEARIAGEVGVTAAAIPGASAVYQARKKPFTRMVDGVKKTRPAMGTARAALGPVGKALSGFATPLGIAALTPLNVASSLYEGDSAYEVATDPLNYLAPALAGTMGSLSKEATRGMGATSKLAKTLRLGMSPGAIKMISRRFGLPGLALSSGISLFELADEYKSGRGIFGKKE
jgi:hypothetical protein